MKLLGRHHNTGFPSEYSNEIMNLGNQILRLLYLSKNEGLSLSKIKRMLPERHIKRQLIELCLHDFIDRDMVRTQKVKISCDRQNPVKWTRMQNILPQNPDHDHKLTVNKDAFGNFRHIEIIDDAYFITNKGIEMIKTTSD